MCEFEKYVYMYPIEMALSATRYFNRSADARFEFRLLHFRQRRVPKRTGMASPS